MCARVCFLESTAALSERGRRDNVVVSVLHLHSFMANRHLLWVFFKKRICSLVNEVVFALNKSEN